MTLRNKVWGDCNNVSSLIELALVNYYLFMLYTVESQLSRLQLFVHVG